ncbi:MAG: hypothetical protein AAB652_01360 [Patescibacteria group bacterium]
MKKAITISIGVFALIGGFLVFYNSEPVSNPVQNNTPASDMRQKWDSKTNEQASVTVTVTPFDLFAQSKEWKFDVVLDTHSVELDQDMTKVAVLVDEGGKEYKPLRFEGDPAAGHHREGTLIFGQITPVPKAIELKIKNIGGVPERLFKWNME